MMTILKTDINMEAQDEPNLEAQDESELEAEDKPEYLNLWNWQGRL